MHPHRALHNNPPGSERSGSTRTATGLSAARAQSPQPLADDHVRAQRHRWNAGRPACPGSQYQMQRPLENLMPEAAAVCSRRLPADPLRHLAPQDEKLHQRQAVHDEVRIHPHARTGHTKLDHRDPRLAADRPARHRSVAGVAAAMGLAAWLRPGETAANAVADTAAQLSDTDPRARLHAISEIARSTAAVRQHLPQLATALHDDFEPVAVAAPLCHGRRRSRRAATPARSSARDHGDDPTPTAAARRQPARPRPRLA